MKFLQTVVAAAALTAALGAQAQVTASIGGGTGTFATLSGAGLDGGSLATLSGGTVYTSSNPMATQPGGTIFGGAFLAAGIDAGTTATLDFTGAGVSNLSFLWGSIDTYNVLTVTTTGGQTTTFKAADIAGLVADSKSSSFVQFTGTGGSMITAVSFTDIPNTNAFEVADFNVSPVPEPQTYALLLAGLGAVVFVSRRRQS